MVSWRQSVINDSCQTDVTCSSYSGSGEFPSFDHQNLFKTNLITDWCLSSVRVSKCFWAPFEGVCRYASWTHWNPSRLKEWCNFFLTFACLILEFKKDSFKFEKTKKVFKYPKWCLLLEDTNWDAVFSIPISRRSPYLCRRSVPALLYKTASTCRTMWPQRLRGCDGEESGPE